MVRSAKGGRDEGAERSEADEVEKGNPSACFAGTSLYTREALGVDLKGEAFFLRFESNK